MTETTSFLVNREVLSQQIVTIDRYPTLEFMVKGQKEKTGLNLSVILKYWIIYYEDKIIFLQCAGLDDDEFYELEYLYNLITNSVIFPEQYN